ncbi:MAG: hypothetical protein COA57_01720 [Flavobacteriales bacterium]|nr:MAG: hypothetical protein COA57_01720 [Flavobacteriales bacterium]
MHINTFCIKYNRYLALIIIALSFCLYCNTLFNEYALDDILVINDNEFVKQGIDGIPEIITTDFFLGYENVENDLAGGRYRPFSLVVFAIEYQLFGESPLIGHLINLLLYALLVFMLFRFLNAFVFKESQLLSFLSVLIFTVHPIHTEVVANIKSRDEIIALLLLVVAMYSYFKHTLIKRNMLFLIAGLFCFFLALLTKESAITFLGIVPLLLYFFNDKSLKHASLLTLPFVFVTAGYLLVRNMVVGFESGQAGEILNAPFLYATAAQAFATKIFVLGKYLGLLVFPHPLSYDYSYNQIPYLELFDFRFFISLLMNSFLLVYAIMQFKKKSVLSFSIIFYFITISIVSNFAVDIGAPMADRLLFQPSLGFSIAFGAIIMKIIGNKKKLGWGLVGLMVFAGSFKTISRNLDWKNNNILFLKDVEACPNSAKTNMNAAVSYLRLAKEENDVVRKEELLLQGIEYGKKSLKIHPDYVDALLNLGVIYFNLDDLDNTAEVWLRAKELMPLHPNCKKFTEGLSGVYLKKGYALYEQGSVDSAIDYYQRSLKLNPRNAETWYNLGGNYLLKSDTVSALNAWGNVLKIEPNHLSAKEWIEKVNN